VAWALFFVAFPFGVFAFVTLRRRQAAQPDLVEDPPNPRRADREVVVALQIHRDLLRPEMVLLVQPEDLLYHLRLGRIRRVMRSAGAIPQALLAFVLVALQPAVIGLAADAVIAAGRCDVSADFLDMADHGELMFRPAVQLTQASGGGSCCHGIFLPKGRPNCQGCPSVAHITGAGNLDLLRTDCPQLQSSMWIYM
jgi:hypothetical protein